MGTGTQPWDTPARAGPLVREGSGHSPCTENSALCTQNTTMCAPVTCAHHRASRAPTPGCAGPELLWLPHPMDTTLSPPLAADSGTLPSKEEPHPSPSHFCLVCVHVCSVQTTAARAGLCLPAGLMTTRNTKILHITRLCKALLAPSTLHTCNASHVQEDTFSLPTSARNPLTDLSEVKINPGGLGRPGHKLLWSNKTSLVSSAEALSSCWQCRCAWQE